MCFAKRLVTTAILVLGAWIALPVLADGFKLPDLAPGTPTSEIAKRGLAENAKCTRCHDENSPTPVLSIYQTPHGVKGDPRTPSCQSCHGQSEQHMAGSTTGGPRPSPDVVFKKHAFPAADASVRAGQCLACHTDTRRDHWDGSKHQINGIACNDCHVIHSPRDTVRVKQTQREVCFACHKEQRADTHKISTHPLDAGKMACSDCHNPHGSTGPKLLVKNTVTETCLTCHAEKRGPFLWEHQPVNEDCTNCHTPHGSNITPLLKARAPFLCDDCHDGPHNSQSPFGSAVGGIQAGGVAAGGNPSTSAVGRACMNCHVMIHGSNSPAGAYLHR